MGELSNTTINGVSYDFKDAGAARQSHSHTKSQITDFPTSMPASDVSAWAKASAKPTYTASEVGAIATSAKGAANGVASLDSTGKVPSSQLPSYVDDVLEYSAKSSFPATGETGKIYVDTSTNKTYRWGGSAYAEISESLALGDTSSTAYYGDKGKTAYDHATESGRLTTATASGLYKVASTAQGHIASLTPVAKSDITGLGIPGTDTNTHRPIYVDGDQLLGDNTTALNIAAGNNVTLTPNTSTGVVAISAKDTKYSNATTSAAGLMSAADKTKLNGIDTSSGWISTSIISSTNYVIGSNGPFHQGKHIFGALEMRTATSSTSIGTFVTGYVPSYNWITGLAIIESAGQISVTNYWTSQNKINISTAPPAGSSVVLFLDYLTA